MKIFQTVALAPIVLIYFGCSENPTVDSPSVLVPLSLGNEWIYAVDEMDSTRIDTLRVVGEEVLFGENVYLYSSDIRAVNRKDGYYIAFPYDTMRIIAQYPVSKDTIYRRDTLRTPTQVVTTTFSCSSVMTSVTVPAGTFQCYKYTITHQVIPDGSNHNIYLYYAPNIGEIQSSSDYYRRDLIAYHIK